MQGMRLDPRITSALVARDGDFTSQMRKAKSLSEVYSLANRIRRSDTRCGVPEAFFNPFMAWHNKNVNLAVGLGGNGLDNGRVCVAGPGNCGDFQLESIAERFREVVLLDVDGEGPELARQGLPTALREKVKLCVCDASGYVGRVIARAEEAIRSSQSGDAAAAAVREILCAPPLGCDFRPLPLETGSFDLVLSDDVLPNIYPLPIVWLDTQLKLKFDDGCSLSDGGQIPPMQIAAGLIHVVEALRILKPHGILALSASVAYVTVAKIEDMERTIYSYNGPEGETVLLSAPRFGFDGERHVGLDIFQCHFSAEKMSTPVSFATYPLQLTEAQEDTIPGIGKAETFIAALHEFACLKKNG